MWPSRSSLIDTLAASIPRSAVRRFESVAPKLGFALTGFGRPIALASDQLARAVQGHLSVDLRTSGVVGLEEVAVTVSSAWMDENRLSIRDVEPLSSRLAGVLRGSTRRLGVIAGHGIELPWRLRVVVRVSSELAAPIEVLIRRSGRPAARTVVREDRTHQPQMTASHGARLELRSPGAPALSVPLVCQVAAEIGRAVVGPLRLDDVTIASHLARIEVDAHGVHVTCLSDSGERLRVDGISLSSGQVVCIPVGSELQIGRYRIALREVHG